MRSPHPVALWQILLLAGAAHVAAMALYVYRSHGDVSAFVCVGLEEAGLPQFADIKTHVGVHGYDGKFYFLLAQAPFAQYSRTEIDVPAGRQMRILYPLLAWLCSGGQPALLLWVSPALNVLALLGITAFGWDMTRRYGVHPLWALLLPVATGASLATLRDLTDPLATLTVCCLVRTWIRDASWPLVAVTCLAAVFAREQNAPLVALLAVLHLSQKRWRHAAGAGAACLAFAGWYVFLKMRYPPDCFLPVAGNFALPFQGFVEGWQMVDLETHRSASVRLFLHASATYMLLLTSVGLALVVRQPRDLFPCGLALAGVALALVAGHSMYVDLWAYARVLAWLPLGMWVRAVQTGNPRPLWLLAPTLVWFVASVARPLAG